MKTLAPNFVLILLLLFTTAISAQECPDYLYMTEGRTYTHQNLDKKGKHETTTRCTVNRVEKTDEGLESFVTIDVLDKKGKDLMRMEHTVRCDGKNLYFDVSNFISAMQEAVGEMDISMNADFLAFPQNINVGDKLEEGTADVELGSSGMGISVRIYDREVLAKEDVTTPAGTFECYKIAYKLEYNMGFMSIYASAIEWWNEEYLIVKAETFKKNGKLVSSNILESID